MSFLKNYSLLLVLSFLLSGCAGKIESLKENLTNNDINWQLRPDAPVEREVNDIKVVYLMPEYIAPYESSEDALHFYCSYGGRETKQEKLFINKENNLWTFERRTDNGVAGSGVVFDVEMLKVKSDNNTKISLIVKKERKYQEGLVLPFAVPKFDIKDLNSG